MSHVFLLEIPKICWLNRTICCFGGSICSIDFFNIHMFSPTWPKSKVFVWSLETCLRTYARDTKHLKCVCFLQLVSETVSLNYTYIMDPHGVGCFSKQWYPKTPQWMSFPVPNFKHPRITLFHYYTVTQWYSQCCWLNRIIAVLNINIRIYITITTDIHILSVCVYIYFFLLLPWPSTHHEIDWLLLESLSHHSVATDFRLPTRFSHCLVLEIQGTCLYR